jgi:D-alanyl-D-alanine-carboxypeptidase/D-alanyl-D-alanine-endopeptidase
MLSDSRSALYSSFGVTKLTGLLVCAGLILWFVGPGRAAAWEVPDDIAIQKILATRVDQQRRSVGIVVGVVDAKGHRRIISYGHLNQGDNRPLDGNTVFEIGSVTKVFTSLLLAQMVVDGQAKPDDPVSKYLPSSVHVPERNGRQIELIDLATHTSGLPGALNNMRPKDPQNPWADYSAEKMYEFLNGYVLQRDIGSAYQYSNIGAGLLGNALSLRAHTDYETLVRRKILHPLHMNSSGITLSNSMKSRLAVGHNAMLKPVQNWDVPGVPGAGALRSTANDLLNFLAAELSPQSSGLKSAMELQLSVTRPTPVPNFLAGLGWFVRPGSGGPVPWKDGATGGYSSYIGFSPSMGEGVVVLANSSPPEEFLDIGEYLLLGRPLANPQPDVIRREITLDERQKERFTGQYQLDQPRLSMTVRLESGQLTAEWTGQPKRAFFPESSTELFSKTTDAQLSFDMPADGSAKSVTLHINGRQFLYVRAP